MVSEQVLRYKHYEAMEEKEDFQKIFKVAQSVVARKILNRLFFATYPEKSGSQKKKLSYKQIYDIVQALID